ncbi:MAG TPA: DNA recombination protein RmuC, partial [Candidatus Dojkabacteria bacterium]|nr:DNA recombination protein RmuC [Candidatus Dojkabacteria bacterium]
ILAGHFIFTAILIMVKQSYDNFRVQRNIYTIISDVKAFEKEFGMFSESYYKIGEKISGLQKQYDVVSTTRFRQLEKRVEKVTQEGLKDEEGSPMLLDLKDEE